MQVRFSRRRLRTHWWLLAILLLLTTRCVIEYWTPSPPEVLAEGFYFVERVVDCDTLLLTSGARVRLQGIEMPEISSPTSPLDAWGAEASAFTQGFIADAGGSIHVSLGAERLDSYGRNLAFVWHGNRMLNEELVRAGLARARLGYRYSGRMKRRLAAAEEEARESGRGIWSTAIPLATNPE
jgi:micrococcal nuclease